MRIVETVSRRLQQARHAARGAGHEARNELADNRAPQGLRSLGVHHAPAVPFDAQLAAVRLETDFQLRQLLVTHQHQELSLGQPLRIVRIEGRGAMGERETPVVRQALAGIERDPLQVLGR